MILITRTANAFMKSFFSYLTDSGLWKFVCILAEGSLILGLVVTSAEFVSVSTIGLGIILLRHYLRNFGL